MINAKQIIRAAAFLLVAIAVASCSKDGLEPDTPGGGTSGPGGDITFDIGFAPATKVSTGADFRSEWENGDAIGIFACASGTTLASSGNYIHNVKLTYSGGTWKLDDGVELWYLSSGGKLDFYAYHPYDPAATDPTAIAFNVSADQNAATTVAVPGGGSADILNYNLSDLLTAKSDNNGSGWGKGQTVSLQFTHTLAMVELTLYDGGGIDANEMSVQLLNIYTGATVDLSGIDATVPGSGVSTDAVGNAETIIMYRVEQSGTDEYTSKFTFRALVPAQRIERDARMFLIPTGDLLLQSSALTDDLELLPAQAEQVTQKIPFHIHTVDIPAGTFLMGSPTTEPNQGSSETQHEVTLTKAFNMSKYPVTFAQYDAFCEATGRNKPSDQGWGRGSRPVINVTWHDAVAFCEWVSQTTVMTCRLPTEAEWEYACRGGQTESLPFGIGDGTRLTYGMANYYVQYSYEMPGGEFTDNTNHSTHYKGRTTPVGEYDYPNGYGLYDMHGNVWEWGADWYGTYDSNPVTDPTGPSAGDYRVLRGGSWRSFAQYCRSAYRNYAPPGSAGDTFGFRVVFVP